MPARIGRPPRADAPQKTTLLLARSSKQAAYQMASRRGVSMGKLVEALIAEALEKEEAGK